MRYAPSYGLYGEKASQALADFLHCESIAERSRNHHWEIRPHQHPHFLQVLWLRKGSARVVIEERSQNLLMPGLVVLPAGLEHAFSFSRDTDGIVLTLDQAQLLTLAIGEELVRRAFTGWCLSIGSRHPLTAPIDTIMQSLMLEFKRTASHRDVMLRSLIEGLCVLLGRLLADIDLQSGDGSKSRKQRHLAEFRRLLDMHYREHWPLTGYAQQLGITSTQLNRVCKDQTGLKAIELVRQRLLLEAERDLRFASLDIKAIALLLGFSDPAYFSRFFKQHRGMTPGEFRNR